MLIDRDIEKASALIIDSNPTSRSVMAAQLRDLGVGTVKQTARVNDARLLLEARPYDIVLCDYHFDSSEMSGQDLLDELRRENLLPHSTVFIMVTGEATYARVVEAAETALDGYLLKPYTATALGERLTEARRRKRTLKEIFDALERQEIDSAARLCLQRFAARQPYWRFCARFGAELMLLQNRNDEAKQIYEAVNKDKPLNWARLGVARSLIALGDMTPARRQVEALLRDAPDHADAYDVLGRVLIDQGDFAQALTTYRTAAQLTPGCLQRLQHCGTLAFYQGERDEALRMLERTISMGLKSKLFDVLTLMLVALLRFDAGDQTSLNFAHDQIKRLLERQPEARRLQRFEQAAAALRALAGRHGAEAMAIGRALATQCHDEDFDLEAANVLLSLWTRLPLPEFAAGEFDALLRSLGLRFCASKAMTEALVAAAQRQEAATAIIRACHAEINGIAEQAMSHSLRGEPRAAVESLLQQGASTRNAKLIEMAGRVARRHHETIDDSQSLLDEAQQLQRRFGQPTTHIAGVRSSNRSPGGMVMRL